MYYNFYSACKMITKNFDVYVNSYYAISNSTHLELSTIADTPKSCSLDLEVGRSSKYRSTILMATWSVRESKSFMLVTSTSQSSKMYLQSRNKFIQVHQLVSPSLANCLICTVIKYGHTIAHTHTHNLNSGNTDRI